MDLKLLQELQARRATAYEAGGKEKVAARHQKGIGSARERVESLLDANSFLEFGLLANHDCHPSGMEGKAGDGVITGVGYCNGQQIAVYSQDFTVGGGTLGRIHAKKICDLMDYARRMGIPVIGINDSGGARIQEGVEALSGYGQVFFKNVELSGVVPQISIIAGPCAGGAAYSPALTDFLIMTRRNAQMFTCGPEVIKAATGESVPIEQFAGADAQASFGNIHFVAEDDAAAMALAKRLLSFLPSHNIAQPPHRLEDRLALSADPSLYAKIPDDPKDPFDVHTILESIVDNGDFFEVQASWAQNIVIGFARMSGVVIGIVANQPMVKAGTIDIEAADKAARFVHTCNAFNIPLLTCVDVPGFMPGLQQERNGILRHGGKLLFAYAAATVAKVTLIMRKAYGGAYLAMCSADMGADYVFAWPTAEIAVMGAKGAVRVLYHKEISNAANPEQTEAALNDAYTQAFSSPYPAAAKGLITDVIDPAETRAVLSLAFRNVLSKRSSCSPKTRGQIPF